MIPADCKAFQGIIGFWQMLQKWIQCVILPIPCRCRISKSFCVFDCIV